MPDRPGRFGGSQQSGQWQQPLPNGSPASVYLIADQNNFQQAASRLNFLGQGLTIVMDCHGWNLKTAAGKLCLLTVAFMDGNLQVFIFDVMQLGEQMNILAPFFTNPNAAKISSDASTHATVLAHKFGINLTGVIDAQWAYETVQKRTMVKPLEILEWCGMAPIEYKNEAERLATNPEVWGQRPLSQPVISHAVQGICLQHAAASVMWSHLDRAFGPTAFNKVAMNSQRRAEMAAAAAKLWLCYLHLPTEDYEKEANLDDWLAKRFGRQEQAPPSAAVRARSADKPPLPETAFREGDSPRTAAWRAAVAELNPPRIQPSRQRSASPTLENWLNRREERRASARPGASHRASSLPSRERERGRLFFRDTGEVSGTLMLQFADGLDTLTSFFQPRGATGWVQAVATRSGKPHNLVLREGSGDVPKSGDRVTVHYVCRLADETIVDDSRGRGEPMCFALGQGDVIAGWESALPSMHCGELATLIVHPEMSYGEAQLGAVPPGSCLHFELELLSVLPAADAPSMFVKEDMSVEDTTVPVVMMLLTADCDQRAEEGLWSDPLRLDLSCDNAALTSERLDPARLKLEDYEAALHDA
eukprot:Skav229204  [mRNA]  locus=scaffold2439:46560:63104:+ [translate_table: standard]